MPTGYTYKCTEPYPPSLNDFLAKIATGMGFMITYRDHADADPRKIPPFEPSKHTLDTYKEYKREYAYLQSLDEESWRQEMEKDNQSAREYNEHQDKENEFKAQRYDWYIKHVEAWDVPDELSRMKEFALEQLRESKDFDVFDYRQKIWADLEEYKQMRLSQAKRMRDSYKQQWKEELERVEERNRYLYLFLESLPQDKFPDLTD